MSAPQGRPKGRRQGFAEHGSALPKPAGCAKQAVERKSKPGAAKRRTFVTPFHGKGDGGKVLR